MNATKATVENADVTPSATTANANTRVSGPTIAIQANRRLVAAMAMPARNNPRTTPKRPVNIAAARAQTTVTSQPRPFEYVPMSALLKPTSM